MPKCKRRFSKQSAKYRDYVSSGGERLPFSLLHFSEALSDLLLVSSILYDRFQEAKNAGTLEHTSIPVSSLQPQLSSIPFGSGSLNGSTSMHQHHPPPQHQHQHQHQQLHSIHTQAMSPSAFQQHHHHPSLSQGYHPSQFITHPGLMHDGNDSLMMHPLHHDMQGVDPTMSMSL